MSGIKTCKYYFIKGKKSGQKCSKKVSKIDPEYIFCAQHKRCVFPAKHKCKNKVEEEEFKEKYIDYITFKVTAIKNYK